MGQVPAFVRWSIRIYAVLVVLFLFFPVMIVVPLSFSGDRFLTFPPTSFSLRWYQNYFNDPTWMTVTFRSLRIGFFSSLLASVAGLMLAIWLTRSRGFLPRLFQVIAVAPAVIPNVLIALGFFIILVFFRMTGSEIALIAAHAVLGLPFVVVIVGRALADLDPTLERAARIFGAGPIRAFLQGSLPAILPSVFSAALFAFITSFDELIIALFASGRNVTLPVRLWTELRFEIDPTVSAVSVVLITLTTLGMCLAEWLRRRQARGSSL